MNQNGMETKREREKPGEYIKVSEEAECPGEFLQKLP